MHYRDKLTGRFASAATWRRSLGHGGTRYVRQRQNVSQRTKPPLGAPRRHAVSKTAPPSGYQRETGPIPVEFLESAENYFESGYESDEEDEYP